MVKDTSSYVFSTRSDENGTSLYQDEIGYSALDLGIDEFYDQLTIIKDHLKQNEHPLTKFIALFDREFWKSYRSNLCVTTSNETKIKEVKSFDDIIKGAFEGILHFIYITLIAIIKFYNLKLGKQQLWKDLLCNIVTSHVLKGYTYFTMHNLISLNLEDRIMYINHRIDGLKGLKPEHLGVSDIISLNPALRLKYFDEPSDPGIIQSIKTPYYRTIERLPKIQEIENPILKLEFLYQLFTE